MNRPFTMAAEGLERHRFSVTDIDRMVEAGVLDAEGRWELLDGEIVPMAAQYSPHGRLVLKIATSLVSSIDARRFEVFTGVTVDLNEFTRVDPDIYVAKAGVPSKIIPSSHVLWAIEVSDATRRKDLKVKAPLYAAAGIPEYWVVDLEERVTHLHRGPSPSGWTEPVAKARFEEPIAPRMFPELGFAIADL